MNFLTSAVNGRDFNVVNLGLKNVKSYLLGVIFVAGSIALPFICHQFSLGGPVFLPIYFFALIAGYKFGYKVGLLTAVASPFLNHLLTAMPPLTSVPIIMLKSSMLAMSASLVANYSKKIKLTNIILVVLMYQGLSSAIVFIITKNFAITFSDIIIGYPGLIFQVVGGYLFLNKLSN